MSGTIRPVTTRIPSSWKIWDETQLPLAVTVQPLWTSSMNDDTNNDDDNKLTLLQHIPKCQHCGAPHPSSARGGATLTILSHPMRPTTSVIRTEPIGENHNNNGSSSSTNRSNAVTFLCHLCHHVSTVNLLLPWNGQQSQRRLPGEDYENDNDDEDSSHHHTATATAETFALPLRLPTPSHRHRRHVVPTEPVYRVPALTGCPLLWYIVLDGSCTDTWYWRHVQTCLQETLAVMPRHVHVALLWVYSAASTTKQQYFAIYHPPSCTASSSSGCHPPPPHIRRYSATTQEDDDYEAARQMARAAHPLAPRDDTTTSHTLVQQPSLTTQPPLPPFHHHHHDKINKTTTNNDSWIWMIRHIATGLQLIGQAAGQRPPPTSSSSSLLLPYAGAFVTCWRPSSPHYSTSHTSFSTTTTTTTKSQRQLSQLCTAAVLTVQNVFVTDPTAPLEWQPTPPAPLITSLETPALVWYAAETNEEAESHRVVPMTETQGWATWKATWPWRRNVVYGASLRLRTSPGLTVATDDDDDDEDDVPKDEDDDDATRAAILLLPKEGGLTGPAVASMESACLWSIPSMDPYTTLVIDLALEETDTDMHNNNNTTTAGSLASDTPRPQHGMIQACIAYTALETDADGQVWTVRRIRVAHRTLPRAATVESLYRRVDPEALAVILWHKLVRCRPAAQRLSIGEEWLEAFLVAVYESAVQEDIRQKDLQRHGIENTAGYFVSAERLLDKAGGELSDTDILLAQGHNRLRPIVLLVFLLLQQCRQEPDDDAALDRHGLSLSDLVGVSPEALTRCLAPRLQLWCNDTVLVDLMDLRHESVLATIREEISLLQNPRDVLLLVLDAPDQIIVANARACLPGSSQQRMEPPRLGPNLQSTLQDMADSYPIPPPIIYGGGDSWLNDVCREDKPLGNASNFDAWRFSVANAVREELIRRKRIIPNKNGARSEIFEQV